MLSIFHSVITNLRVGLRFKPNFFLVINLNLINASQGVLVIWRSSIGPLDWNVAEIIRLIHPTDLIINTSNILWLFQTHIFFLDILIDPDRERHQHHQTAYCVAG